MKGRIQKQSTLKMLILALIASTIYAPDFGFYGWESCDGKKENEYVEIESIKFEPEIPTSGVPAYMIVTLKGKQSVYINHSSGIIYIGKGLTRMKFWQGSYQIDLEVLEGKEVVRREYFPSKFGPPGTYSTKAHLYNQGGISILCFDAWFKLRSNPGVEFGKNENVIE